MPHKLTGVRCEEVVRLVQWRIGDAQSIIAWLLYRGSIPLYDTLSLALKDDSKSIPLRVENTIISCKSNAIKTEIEVG